MIAEIVFNAVFILLATLSFYYVNRARKYESYLDKKVLNFFSLGLFLIVVKSVAAIAVTMGVSSLLLSSTAIIVYSYLTAGCFFFGALFLKNLGITSEE